MSSAFTVIYVKTEFQGMRRRQKNCWFWFTLKIAKNIYCCSLTKFNIACVRTNEPEAKLSCTLVCLIVGGGGGISSGRYSGQHLKMGGS